MELVQVDGLFDGSQMPEMAQQAMLLNGSVCGGYQIEVEIHPVSKDGTELQISNVPPGLNWQELKDHFSRSPAAKTISDVAASTAEVKFV